jgi:hypothetical protein
MNSKAGKTNSPRTSGFPILIGSLKAVCHAFLIFASFTRGKQPYFPQQ